LLAFSRRDAFEARPIDLNAAVQGVVPMLKRLLGHEIEIRVETACDLHSVKADDGQLEQVLVNLSVNAWDAMRGGGTLTIRTRNVELREGQVSTLTAGEYVLLEVCDDGHGMDEATRRRVFEPFFTTKAQGSGTGLGMAIVYGIVHQGGGHIDVRSGVGMGTDVAIYLPRTHEQPMSIPAVSTVRRFPARGRILLVDDEPLVKHSFARVLRRLGYELITASHATEAIELVARRPELDLVITDVVMPDLNGVQLIERLSELGVKAKVLYVSGFADGLLNNRAGLGDRVEFLAKPVGVRQLEDKVRELLQEGRADRSEAAAGP
jgi:signal transduction histidine kinase